MASLDLLSTFLEIYRSGSLSAAAQRLGVTQPAVTGQLARLEEQVGEPLFVRSRKGVTPTPRAAALATRVGRHVDELRDALGSADEPPTLSGTVRIGGAAEVMTLRVLPALAPLTGRGLYVPVTLGLAEDLLKALAAGSLDLVVSAVRPTGGAVLAVPLVDEEFLLVAPPAMAHTVDPERLRERPAEALAHLPLVAYGEDLPIVRRYWRSEFGRRPPNPVALVVPDLRAVLAVVEAGAGISVLPRYLVGPALTAGTVAQLHEPEFPPLNTLYLATRRGAPASPALAVVREHLQGAAREWGGL
ncbi:LysR family transcriptional regulator [Streptomyces sp. ISL-22]|uniref:LysR family transcriptional regulator n=1 Tax=unclassified Streptomyces TaxID=2593676 RepID=UPI001BE97BC2|nr:MULTISPECIES: LysR family transcriptional regulator [unclassified Streptomyces]MBT2422514.1 LysR family transcriptional regulator [Streptomyces sp. ISL-24]MBT2436565.1 LysR family transcriptional regulator [Streptomyces sp. ISL-22]